MNYYIYENWTAEKKAKIHKGNCPYCNQGEGVSKEKTDGRNGCWHGPFKDFNEAKKTANSIPDRDVSCCKMCNPEIND